MPSRLQPTPRVSAARLLRQYKQSISRLQQWTLESAAPAELRWRLQLRRLRRYSCSRRPRLGSVQPPGQCGCRSGRTGSTEGDQTSPAVAVHTSCVYRPTGGGGGGGRPSQPWRGEATPSRHTPRPETAAGTARTGSGRGQPALRWWPGTWQRSARLCWDDVRQHTNIRYSGF